jgi:anti-sigma B factor antagonist
MTEARIFFSQKGDLGLIRIEGEGTFESAAQLKKTCGDLVMSGAKNFAIDLTQCEAVDSTFLGTLLVFAMKLKKAQGQVRIFNASADMKRSFSYVGLDRLFEFAEMPDKAG